MPKVGTAPVSPLRCFEFHGVDLKETGTLNEYLGECPFCAKPKFYTNEEGLWDCKACGRAGNPVLFIRAIWEESYKATSDYSELAKDRCLLSAETPLMWDVAKSISTGEWIAPLYNIEMKVVNVCQWIAVKGNSGGLRRALLPTPGFSYGGLFMPLSKSKQCKIVYIAEGIWDAMAIWEVLNNQDRLDLVSVISMPSAHVFNPSMYPLLADKDLYFFCHNDYPKPVSASYDGVMRLLPKIYAAGSPKSARYLSWGDGGHTAELKDGYDTRDALKEYDNFDDRAAILREIIDSRMKLAPEEWTIVKFSTRASKCESWEELLGYWQEAMEFTSDLRSALVAMLAVAASTSQSGNQLFLQVIANAGSGKTQLCDAMLTSRTCKPLEHLTGFLSGTRGAGKEYSFISRSNHCTLITAEGDLIVTNPSFHQLMGQVRRIFDGVIGATYKNSTEDKRFIGLRTPWIMAGTPSRMLNSDQSRFGDRFLRVIIGNPNEDVRTAILKRVGQTALNSVAVRSNCQPDSTVDAKMSIAYRKTGGYVDYLREVAEERLKAVKEETDESYMIEKCCDLADFTALMRSRPEPTDRHDEAGAGTELPTRLLHQFVRLACCIAVVLNKEYVDDECLSLVRKVAIDTAFGRTLELARLLYESPKGSASVDALHASIGQSLTNERVGQLVRFMCKIEIVKPAGKNREGDRMWKLTDRARELYSKVVGQQ